MALLSNAQVWPAITAAARKRRQRATPRLIAVAYLGPDAPTRLPLSRGDTLIVDASAQAVRAGVTSATSLSTYAKAGVAIHSRAGLHAKVYAFADVAYVGSANASDSRLIEVVVEQRAKRDVAAARRFVTELAEATYQLTDERIEELGRMKVNQRSFEAAQSASDDVDMGWGRVRRIWLIDSTQVPYGRDELQVETATRRNARSNAGPRARVELEPYIVPTHKAGDLDVGTDALVLYDTDTDAVWAPAIVREKHPVGRHRRLLWLARDSTVEPIAWSALTDQITDRTRARAWVRRLEDAGWLLLDGAATRRFDSAAIKAINEAFANTSPA